MNAPAVIYVLRWSIWETFRQSLASRVFYLMLGINALCILFCLSIHLEGDYVLKTADDVELYDAHDRPLIGPNPTPPQLVVAFGAVRVPAFRDGRGAVLFLQSLLAKWVAGGAGLLLALVWTAGFLPEFLQASSASVLLAKPVPRWCLLVGKYLGVVLFVAFQASVFFVGTWLALGMRTGYWPEGYFWAIPVLVLHFALVYSFSALLAVCTRSTTASLFGGVLFWLVCFGINFSRHAAAARGSLDPDGAEYPAFFRSLVEACYWMLPKPVDMMMLLDKAIGADEHFASPDVFDAVMRAGGFFPELSLLTSFVFAFAMFAVAAQKLANTDY